MDQQSGHSLHHTARTTTVFGEFSDLSDVAAVADFKHVPRNHEALALGVIEVQRRTILGQGESGETVGGRRRGGSDNKVVAQQGVVSRGQDDSLLGLKVTRRHRDGTRGVTVRGDGLDSVRFRSGDAVVQLERRDAGSNGLNDSVRVNASMKELGRDEGQLTEVTLEVVDRSRDSVGVGVSGGADASGGRRASGRTAGINQFRELTLEFRADNGFVVLELTSLLVNGGHQVLNGILVEGADVRTSADDGRFRGDEVNVDITDGLRLSAVLVGIGRGGSLILLQPSRKATGAIRGSAIIDGRHDIRSERDFHRTLEVDGSLSQLTAQFVLNTSDVQDILSEVGDVHRSAEQVDVIFDFSAVTNGVLLEGVVGGRVRRVDVLAIKDAEFDGRLGVAVDLPAESGISGLRATLSHRGDGRFLSVDVGDEVREFFTDTNTGTLKRTLILELVLE